MVDIISQIMLASAAISISSDAIIGALSLIFIASISLKANDIKKTPSSNLQDGENL